MSTATRSILRSLSPRDKLNILLFNNQWVEVYNHLLSKTNDNYFIWTSKYPGRWSHNPVLQPTNIYHLPDNQELFDQTLDFDVVVCHNRLGQYELARQLSHAWHLPLVVVHHDFLEGPILSDNGPGNIDQAKAQMLINRNGDINVYSSREMSDSWKSIGKIIPPGIASAEIKKRENSPYVCLISPSKDPNLNNFIAQTAAGKVSIKVLQPSIDLGEQFHAADYYLNLDNVTFNLVTLWAMSYGCIPISIKNRHLYHLINSDFVFEHLNNLTIIFDRAKWLHPSFKEQITEQVKKSAEQYSIDAFIDNWKYLLGFMSKTIYRR